MAVLSMAVLSMAVLTMAVLSMAVLVLTVATCGSEAGLNVAGSLRKSQFMDVSSTWWVWGGRCGLG